MDAKDRSEIIKNYAQILAIVVAAVWTLWVFNEKEAPSLKARPTWTSALHWSRGSTPDTCKATYEVNLQNDGISPIEINRVQIRQWRFPPWSALQADGYYDFSSVLTKEHSVTDKSYQALDGKRQKLQTDAVLPFVGGYPPGEGYHHSFEWEIKRDTSQLVYFRVDFYRNLDDKKSAWVRADWSPICVGLPETKIAP